MQKDRARYNKSREFNSWTRAGKHAFDKNSLIKTIIRESFIRIPSGDVKRSVPMLRMIVTNQFNFVHSVKYKDLSYEIYLEDLEYNLKTSYGNNFASLEQAKFIADLKLIDLGFGVIDPYLM